MFSAEKFWDKASEKYALSPVKDEASYQTTLEHTRAHLKPDFRALEVGCGTGTTALNLAAHVDTLVSTDLSQSMIDIAVKKVEANNVSNVGFQKASLLDMPFEDQSFDAVMAFNILHLIEEWEDALTNIHGLLKPGGVFISKTGCLKKGGWLWRMVIPPMRLLGIAPPVRILGIPELETFVEKGGFKIVETGTFPLKPQSRFIVAQKI
jgi:ubiquinone/menaquinone biosynthesis C-methylase UbiE